MDINALKRFLYDETETERFYKAYYEASRDPKTLKTYLENLDMDYVLSRHLIIPEKKETIPPVFEDSFFFDLSNNDSIVVQKHERFSPAILHTHTFFELSYVYDGRCTQEISGQKIEMRSGDFCVIPPGIFHSISVFDDSIIFNIMLRRDTLHSMFYAFLNTTNILSSFFLNSIYTKQSNDFIIFHTGMDGEIRNSFLWMLWESMNHQLYYYQAITNTLQLDLFLLVRNYSESVQMPLFNSRLDVQRYALIQYMETHYKNISLSCLSERFHYSNEYTSRLIKDLTGMTYTEVLQKIRTDHAKDLLANSAMTVQAIAEEVGYDTTEHFIRQFKKQVGTTPTAFRKKTILSRPHPVTG